MSEFQFIAFYDRAEEDGGSSPCDTVSAAVISLLSDRRVSAFGQVHDVAPDPGRYGVTVYRVKRVLPSSRLKHHTLRELEADDEDDRYWFVDVEGIIERMAVPR